MTSPTPNNDPSANASNGEKISAESNAAKILNRFWHIRQSDTPEEAFAFVVAIIIAAEDAARSEEWRENMAHCEASSKDAYEHGFAEAREAAAKIADGRKFYDPEGYLAEAIRALRPAINKPQEGKTK